MSAMRGLWVDLGLKPVGVDKGFIERMNSIKAKTYDDVTAPSPGLTKLLELRKKKVEELEAKKDPDAAPALAKTVEQIDAQIEKFRSFSTKAKGEEYVGEDKEFGFRRDLWMGKSKPQMPVKPKPDTSLSKEEALKRDQEYLASLSKYHKELEKWEALQHGQETVTKYDRTPEAQQASELKVDESGVVRSSQDMMQGKEGYVVDPKTGKLHYFDMGKQDSVDVEVDDPTTGGKKTIQQKQGQHHTTPLAGEEVAGAGDIEFKGGLIQSISNISGHYKPKAVQLIQTLEELLKQGALQDKTYQMIDPVTRKGKALEGPLKELYDKMVQAEARVWSKLRDWRQLKETIDAKQAKQEDCAAEQEEFQKLSAQLKPDTDLIARAAEMLKKHGAAPSNRIRDVTVQFAELKDSMTGAQVVKGVVTTKTTAKEFLMTGAGDVTVGGKTTTAQQKQLARKALHEQLEEALAKRRAMLDQQVEKLAAELPEKMAKIRKVPALIESLERICVEQAQQLTKREKKELQTGIARLKDTLNNPKSYDEEAMTKLLEDLEARKEFHLEQEHQDQRHRLQAELGMEDESGEESGESPVGDDLEAFGKQDIKDTRRGQENYTIAVNELAQQTGQSIEQIFEEVMGRKPRVK
jgi:hypothetical protein